MCTHELNFGLSEKFVLFPLLLDLNLPRHLGHLILAQIPRLFALRAAIGNGGGEGVELARAGSAPQTKLSAELVEFPGGKDALRERRAPVPVRQMFGAWVGFRLFSGLCLGAIPQAIEKAFPFGKLIVDSPVDR